MPRTRSEEARQKVLRAAQDVIGDSGVEGFTIEEVAKRSGVAKSTIYRSWENGNTLMFDALDCMIQVFPTPNTGSFEGDLIAFMSSVLPVLSDPKLIQTMLGVVAASASDPEMAAIHSSMMAERMGPIRTIVDLAKGRGELPADLDPDVALDLIEGPFFMRQLIRREPMDDATIRLMADAIGAGLKADRH